MTEERNHVDIEIVKRLQNREEEAFKTIYKEYYKNIYSIAYRYFGNAEDAKDIAQEVFILVFKYIDRLETPEAFYSWMVRIAYNCCHSEYKKKKKHWDELKADELEDSAWQADKYGMEIDYVKDLHQKDARDLVVKTINEMKQEQRTVAHLFFFEQLSYEEIADVASISKGTVASRLNRIKAKLQKVLKEHGYSKASCLSVLYLPNLVGLYRDYVSNTSVEIPDIDSVEVLAAGAGVLNPFGAWGGSGADAMGRGFTKWMLTTLIVIPSLAILVTSAESWGLPKGRLEAMKHAAENAEAPDVGTGVDVTAPLISEFIGEDAVELYFTDESPIDYESLEVYVNGVSSGDYTVNESENALRISKDVQQQVKVVVSDVYGNTSTVKVEFYETYK